MDFSKISLDTPVEDMDEASLRVTLEDVMGAHEANYAAAEARDAEFSELTEDLEAAEALVDEAKSAFAKKAADYTKIDEETLVDRFELSELVSFAEEAADDEAEFSEEPADDPVDDPEDDEVEFSEKPPKAPEIPEGGADYSEKAARRLDRVPGLVLDN